VHDRQRGMPHGRVGLHHGLDNAVNARVGDRPGRGEVNNCVASQGVRVAESYQPASHYWPLQLAETGFFLILTLVLAGSCFWRLNRRRS
jgi:hypothetical protein